MVKSVLDVIPLLASIPVREKRRLEADLPRVVLPADTILFYEGEPGDRAYVVLDGELEVIKHLGTEEERLIRVLGQYDSVGEMSMFDLGHLRSATVRTRTPVLLLEFNHSIFDALLRRYPMVAYKIARDFSLRLNFTDNAIITDLQEKNIQLAQAYQELKQAQAQVIEKEKLEHELQVARKIQQSILPVTLPKLAGYNFGVSMVPARAVGGDLYDIIFLSHDQLGIMIGDVSDKGVPASIFMALTRSLVLACAGRNVSPVRVLQRVNYFLNQMNREGMFVTLLYGILDRVSGEFSYARAGHEIPMVFGALGDLIFSTGNTGQPLGLLKEPIIDEQVVKIPPGGLLLLYTDGVTDAVSLQGEPFGAKNLCRVVGEQVRLGLSAKELCDQLMRVLEEYSFGTAQFDDITVLVAQAEL